LCKIPRNQKLIPQEEEVEQLKWFSKEELLNFYKTKPDIFVSLTKELVDFLMSSLNNK